MKTRLQSRLMTCDGWTRWSDVIIDYTNLAAQFDDDVTPPAKITMIFSDGSKIQYRKKK